MQSLSPHESALRDYLRVLDKRKWVVTLACSSFLPWSHCQPAHDKQYDAVGRIAINKSIPPFSVRDTAAHRLFRSYANGY